MIEFPHRIFMTWKGKRPPAITLHDVKKARALVFQLRQQGNLITGCTLDQYVPDWDDCPVCGQRGKSPSRLNWEAQVPQARLVDTIIPIAFTKRRSAR